MRGILNRVDILFGGALGRDRRRPGLSILSSTVIPTAREHSKAPNRACRRRQVKKGDRG